MLAGGVVIVSGATMGGMYFARRFWVQGGKRQRSGRDAGTADDANVETMGGLKEIEYQASAPLTELDYFKNVDAEGANVKRSIILSFPIHGK